MIKCFRILAIGIAVVMAMGCAFSTPTPVPTPTWTPVQDRGCANVSSTIGEWGLDLSDFQEICLALIDIHAWDVWGLMLWFNPSNPDAMINLFACIADRNRYSSAHTIATDFVELVKTADRYTNKTYYVQLHKCHPSEPFISHRSFDDCLNSLALTGYAGATDLALPDGSLRQTGPTSSRRSAACIGLTR